jgi:hypothetical protein
MSVSGEPRLRIVGRVHNFVTHAAATPFEQIHKEGLVFIAMDGRSYPYWGGDVMRGQWMLRRIAHHKLVELQPWPETGWLFADENAARNAYHTVRQHILERLPGVQVHPDKSEDRELVDPEVAWAEAFYWEGGEAVFLAVDRTNDVIATTLTSMHTTQFSNPEGPSTRNACFSTHTTGAFVAIGIDDKGVPDHVVLVSSPGEEGALIEAGLPNAQPDGMSEPFDLDVPSGLMILAWGRVAGAPLFQASQGHDPAIVIQGFLQNLVARPVPTALDARAVGPLAFALRVNPGVYEVNHWILGTEDGMSMMVMSRRGAPPFQPGAFAPSSPPVAYAQSQPPQQAIFAPSVPPQAFAPAAPSDPEVFPGKRLGRLSEYVALMRGMQSGDFAGALARAGLDMAGYAQVAQAWGAALAEDPELGARYNEMMR